MPVYKLSFREWFNSIVNAPINAPKQALTITYNGAKNKFVILKYAIEPTTNNSKESDIQIALAEGDTEEIRDLKGITTEVALKDLYGQPLTTMKKVLLQTRDQIFDIDELGAMKSARLMGNIVRGKTEDEEGKDISQPGSMILQAMRMSYPSLEKAGVHQYQLLVDGTPSQPNATYMDRRSIEVGEDVNPAFRTYEKQATSMHGMAENDEVASSRLTFRNQNIQNFNQTSLRELELDLAHIYDHTLAGKKSVTGSLTKYVKDHGSLPSIADPNYEVEMSSILGITPAEFADPLRFSSATKEYIHATLEAEVTNIKINADPVLGEKINNAINTQLGFQSGNYPSWMTPEIKNAWDGFIGSTGTGFKPMSVEDRMKAYDGLRNAYLSEGRVLDWRKIEASDLGLEIDATKYGGIRFTHLYGEDILFEYQKKLVESYMIFENHAGEIKRDIFNAAETRGGPNAGRLALERYDAATNNIRLANNMFFSSTTKEILENLRDEKFMSNAFVISRFFNSVPYLDKEFRNLRVYTKLLDPAVYAAAIEKTPTMKWLGKTVFDDDKTPLSKLSANVARFSGIGFEASALPTRGVMSVAKAIVGEEALSKTLENRQIVFHQLYDTTLKSRVSTKVPSGVWKGVYVKSSNVTGLFGRESIFELLNETQKMNLLSGVMPGSVADFIADPTKLESLKNAISTMASARAGYVPLNEFEHLAMRLGFGPGGGRVADAAKYISNFNEALKLEGSVAWLQSLANNGKIPRDELWKFMQGMVNSGKATSLAENKVLGPLNIFNRYANATKDFIYRNIIWGKYGSWIPGSKALRGLLRSLNMSEEIGLIRAAQTWGWVKNIIERGNVLNSIGQGTFSRSAGGFATSKLAGWLATKAASNAAIKALTKSLAYILTNAAGIVSGGIGFLIGTIGTISFKASIKILRGDFVGAYYATREEVINLVNVIKKVVLYPLALLVGIPCGCLLIGIIMLLTVVIPAMFAPHEKLVAGLSGVLNSEIIEVEKTVTTGWISDDLTFTIRVENTSEQPATIGSFKDKFSVVGECAGGGGSGNVFIYGEAGWDKAIYGTLTDSSGEITIAQIEAQFLGKVLQPGESFEYEYYLTDPLTSGDGNATYYNTVEMGAVEEPGRNASDNVSHVVGAGGCTQCPEGWPVTQARVTQIPQSSFTHAGVEAIDFGAQAYGVPGDPIYATHDGVARTGTGWNGGFGDFVEVASPMGFKSMYAHLSVIGVSTGDNITKGQQVGEMGYSGNVYPRGTGGTHLHYEFRKQAGGYPECWPGQPVIMTPPYVPERPTAPGLY